MSGKTNTVLAAEGTDNEALSKASRAYADEIKRLIELLRPAANHYYGRRMTLGECNAARRAVVEFDAKRK